MLYYLNTPFKLALNSQFGDRNSIGWKSDQFATTILFIGRIELLFLDLT